MPGVLIDESTALLPSDIDSDLSTSCIPLLYGSSLIFISEIGTLSAAVCGIFSADGAFGIVFGSATAKAGCAGIGGLGTGGGTGRIGAGGAAGR